MATKGIKIQFFTFQEMKKTRKFAFGPFRSDIIKPPPGGFIILLDHVLIPFKNTFDE